MSEFKDNLFEQIINELENFSDANPPEILNQSDGIGGYEFGGQSCYDAGQNTPITNEDTLTVKIGNYSNRTVKMMVRDILDTEKYESEVVVSVDLDAYNSKDMYVGWCVSDVVECGNYIEITIEYKEVQ